MSKLTISFKKTKREQALLDAINKQEEKSEFIKKAVEYYIKYVEVVNDENYNVN